MLGRILDHAFLDQDLERGACDRAGQRVTTEGRTVLSGLQHPEHGGVRQHRRHRIVAARQGLADQSNVGFYALVLLGQQCAGAAEPGLDLVEDQHDVVAGAKLTHLGEIACRWNDDTGLALDGLGEEGHGVRRDGRFEILDHTEAHVAEAGRERTEAGARARVG